MSLLAYFRAGSGLALALALCSVAASGAPDLKPFDAKSLTEIRRVYAGRPFVMAFWSLHCAPCKQEMVLLKELQAKNPTLPILLVCTDPPEAKPAIAKYLAGQKLGKIETWTYADDFDERVRFAVDRSWRGELPRTYLFDSEHRAISHTGVLEMAWIEAWMRREAPPKAK
jgi:thiol-disulfide isomerase/thioredoxin